MDIFSAEAGRIISTIAARLKWGPASQYRFLDADDFMQEALIALWKTGNGDLPEAFIRTVTRRAMINELRRASGLVSSGNSRAGSLKREEIAVDDAILSFLPEESLANFTEQYDLQVSLNLWADLLNPPQRRIAKKLAQGFKAREIAQEMGYTEGRISQIKKTFPNFERGSLGSTSRPVLLLAQALEETGAG